MDIVKHTHTYILNRHTNIYLCACISFSWTYKLLFTIEYRRMKTEENRNARKVDVS